MCDILCDQYQDAILCDLETANELLEDYGL